MPLPSNKQKRLAGRDRWQLDGTQLARQTPSNNLPQLPIQNHFRSRRFNETLRNLSQLRDSCHGRWNKLH